MKVIDIHVTYKKHMQIQQVMTAILTYQQKRNAPLKKVFFY